MIEDGADGAAVLAGRGGAHGGPVAAGSQPGVLQLSVHRGVREGPAQRPHLLHTPTRFHPSGSTQIRPGIASAPEATLPSLRILQGPGRKLWITETGLSSYVKYNDEQYRDEAAMLGEAAVARALPRWVRYYGDQPDVDGVLVHTIRQAEPASEGETHGRAALNNDWTVRDPGPGTVPRWCYFVFGTATPTPGCEGYCLPASDAPTPPQLFRGALSHLRARPKGAAARRRFVMFLEEGQKMQTQTASTSDG